VGSPSLGLLVVTTVAFSACGGRSAKVQPDDVNPPVVESVPPVACTEELDERPGFETRLATLATGSGLRVEAVDAETGFVAYTVPEPGIAQHSLFVVSATTGEPPVLVASGLVRVPETSELIVRFEASTLLVLKGVAYDVAEELLVWRAGDPGLVSIARSVDPTAVRASRDGRFLSVEANDAKGDGKLNVDLSLVDLEDLSVVPVESLDHARARFLHDSSALLFSGVTDDAACPTRVKRLSLDDRSILDVSCASSRARWEATRDGEWLFHGRDQTAFVACSLDLARTSLTDGSTQVQPCLLSGSGKEFDISNGGRYVAFLSPGGEPGGVLLVQPTEGGVTRELVSSLVFDIVEHFDNVVVYTAYDESQCDYERLMSVPNTGGTAWDLGAKSSQCPTARPVPLVLDHENDALLVLSPDGTLRYQPGLNEEPMFLGCDVSGAALANSRTAIFSAPYQGAMGLFRYDHGSGEVGVLEPAVDGPFVLEPRKDSWLATTVPDAAGSALVQDAR
jgi:hypothetical protein